MARKKVIDLNADTTMGFENPGETAEGYYIGSKTVNTSFGESKLHILQNDKGALGVWGSAQLNAKLSTVKPGTMVYITYLKKVKIPKGTQKLFDVEFDDELTIDVGNTTVNYSSEESDPSDSVDAAADSEPADVDPADTSSGEDEEEAAAEAEKAAAKATAAARVKGTPTATSAEKKAAAQALLNKARATAKAS